MEDKKIIKLAINTVIVKKTKKPNAICIKCNKKFWSYAVTLGFQGVKCEECSKYE